MLGLFIFLYFFKVYKNRCRFAILNKGPHNRWVLKITIVADLLNSPIGAIYFGLLIVSCDCNITTSISRAFSNSSRQVYIMPTKRRRQLKSARGFSVAKLWHVLTFYG